MIQSDLSILLSSVYRKCGLLFSAYEEEPESEEYRACRFTINKQKVLCRSAKITPTKIGAFVTFWKRAGKSCPIEPFTETDDFEFFVVNVRSGVDFGQFVFPKAILLTKAYVFTEKTEGKRGFRVYPPWDSPTSKQALKTQAWQNEYFYKISNTLELEKARNLYQFKL